MPQRSCGLCKQATAILKRPKTGQQICKDCFFEVFEMEVHNTITNAKLFKPGERVAIGASGGKGECRGDRHCLCYNTGIRLHSSCSCHEHIEQPV